jgi:TPR repeat protein
MNIERLKHEADSGRVVAQGLLGIGYLYGSEVETNYEAAFRLLTLASDAGASRPTFHLAEMYARGLGVARDMRKAIELYERVGHAEFDAAIALGRIYTQGSGVPKDPICALEWYSVAKEFEGGIYDCPELEEAKSFVAANKPQE